MRSGGVGDVPWPSSLKVSSRFSLSFSFFPRRRFLPPCLAKCQRCSGEDEAACGVDGAALTFPLFLGILIDFLV